MQSVLTSRICALISATRQLAAGGARRVARGSAIRCLAVVGESGSGKSQLFWQPSACCRAAASPQAASVSVRKKLLARIPRP